MKTLWTSMLLIAVMVFGAVQAQSVDQDSEAEVLAKKNGCFDCHQKEEQGFGPSVRDIANMYRGNNEAKADLINTVRNGGKGNWTEISKGIPMPPYSGRLTNAQIEELVDWMLGFE